MPSDRSLHDDVNALVCSERIRIALAAHVRNWRQCPTPYTIENAVRRAAAERGVWYLLRTAGTTAHRETWKDAP